ncbi:MAG TPA: hypothetical protein VGI96_27315 [Streptosporangiaceae bacterium]|jgi:hypothetical protein
MTAHAAETLAPVIIAVLVAAVPVIRAELRAHTAEIVRALAPARADGRLLLRDDSYALATYRNGRAAAVLGGPAVVVLCCAFTWTITKMAAPAPHSWQFAGIMVAVAIAVWFAAVVPVLRAVYELSVAIAPASGSLSACPDGSRRDRSARHHRDHRCPSCRVPISRQHTPSQPITRG